MKRLGKSTIAIITVIAVLGVTVLTLGLIRIKPDKYFFNDYKYFQVYNLESTYPYASVEDKVAPKLKTARFSVLGALLEGQAGYSPKIEKDEEGDPKYLKSTDITNISATGERYLLHFVYEDMKKITVDGEEYLYNRAFVFIQEGNGEVVEVRAIPYVFERVYNDSDGEKSAENYEIPDLRIKMRTSKIYVAIYNVIAGMEE